jgi:V/A-type H+-transporting ATPase subunit F
MKMFLISDNVDTETGMRLAGVEGVVVHEVEEVQATIKSVLKDQEVGVLLITEKLGKLIPDIIDEIKLNYNTPLVVVIPDRHGTGRTKDSITKYVREAIGLKI